MGVKLDNIGKMIPMVPDTELNEGCGKNYSSLGSGQGRLPGGGGG